MLTPSSVLHPLNKNMAFVEQKPLLFSVIIFCFIAAASSRGPIYTPPNVPRLTDSFGHVPIDQGYSEFFGHPNIQLTNNGSNANLILDKVSGKCSKLMNED